MPAANRKLAAAERADEAVAADRAAAEPESADAPASRVGDDTGNQAGDLDADLAGLAEDEPDPDDEPTVPFIEPSAAMSPCATTTATPATLPTAPLVNRDIGPGDVWGGSSE